MLASVFSLALRTTGTFVEEALFILSIEKIQRSKGRVDLDY